MGSIPITRSKDLFRRVPPRSEEVCDPIFESIFAVAAASGLSLGTCPEVTLREARALRDEARVLLAKGINPRVERKRKRQSARLERAAAPGRPSRQSEAQLKELAKVLKAGSLAAGYATEMWTLPRIGALIQECIWGYLKSDAMPNFCARDLAHLGRYASSRLRSMQRRSSLVMAFWKQAELF